MRRRGVLWGLCLHNVMTRRRSVYGESKTAMGLPGVGTLRRSPQAAFTSAAGSLRGTFHGSLWLLCARQAATRSDLDLLVEFDERPLTLLQCIALEHYLSDLLEVKVDLVERNTLKPTIGRHILAQVVPL